jgi:hypothetical protein
MEPPVFPHVSLAPQYFKKEEKQYSVLFSSAIRSFQKKEKNPSSIPSFTTFQGCARRKTYDKTLQSTFE